MSTPLTTHISTENPRIMVVDGSKVVRKMIESLLLKDVPGATVLTCASGKEAKQRLQEGAVDLVTTSLRLDDIDGVELAKYIREHTPGAYIPIIVVSGDANTRVMDRSLSDITDYFDKSLGMEALSAFISGYVNPVSGAVGKVLYVEDSRVVALATRRMLEKHGLTVNHVMSVEEALEILDTAKLQGQLGADIVLTDVYLKGGLTGKELLEHVRGEPMNLNKGQLPILVMTGDDNLVNQTALLRAGANDLVQKPIEERILITKLCFQLRISAHQSKRLDSLT
jgi:CheY-like chemotaxis protein